MDLSWAYLAIFALVFGDALCAVLPGETTLSAAATFAADGSLSLPLVILAGAAGAVSGDSTLYWIARKTKTRIQSKIDQAMKRETVKTAMGVMGTTARPLLVFSRYVPGMRFAVNATFGLSEYPYRQFLSGLPLVESDGPPKTAPSPMP